MQTKQPEDAIIDLAEFIAKNPGYKMPIHYLRVLLYIIYCELDKYSE